MSHLLVSPLYLPLETTSHARFQMMQEKLQKNKSRKHQSEDKKVVLDGHSLLDLQYQIIQEYIVRFPENQKF